MAGSTKLMTAGGGGVNITPASSVSSDVTVQVPSQNCTLGIQGPAFSAYQSSSQSFANGVFTKVQFQTEEFDTASCFDSATNYRFTPNVAGYYQISSCVNPTAVAAGSLTLATIYKNGSRYKDFTGLGSTGGGGLVSGSALVYLNGSTDYVEMYGYQSTGSSTTSTTGINATYFQGCLVRAA